MTNIAVVASGPSLITFEKYRGRTEYFDAIYLINDALLRYWTIKFSAWVFMDKIMLKRYGFMRLKFPVICPKEYKSRFICWTELVRELKEENDFCGYTTPILCKWIADNYQEYSLHLFGVDMLPDGTDNERWFREARWLKKYLPVDQTSIHSSLMDDRVKDYLLNPELPLSLLSEAYQV